MKKELDNLADSIAKRLTAKGFIIQRYNAYATNSIYLKLDYGVCNSIRISDHQEKKHLKYRYNIGSFVKGCRKEKDKYDRYYYQINEAENMIEKIVRDRDFKKSRYGESGYKAFMEKNRRDKSGTGGFWKEAVLLD